MSKWINKDLFGDFQKEKKEEKDSGGSFIRSNLLWENPVKGTVEQAKVYEGRFVPDPKGKFYKKYYYHFWQSGESWIFVLCPKTDDYKNYCPFCSANSKLYNGTKEDKKQAYLIKRKERFVGNFHVSKDARDDDRDAEKKVIGKVKLYEFPAMVEKKLKNEITDADEGYGYQIFDPSAEGRNFIIKVLSTKKDEKGKQWPDYTSSTFSRTQAPLGSDEEIDALMATCTDIEDYVNSMKTDEDKMVEILKNEFLWELVEQECIKFGYNDIEVSGSGEKTKEEPKKESNEEQKDDSKKEEKEEKEEEIPWDTGKDDEKKEEVKSEPDKTIEPDENDDDLLAELDAM